MSTTILYFPLADARLCLDCGIVTNAPRCPTCGGADVYPLQKWTDRTLYVDRRRGTEGR